MPPRLPVKLIRAEKLPHMLSIRCRALFSSSQRPEADSPYRDLLDTLKSSDTTQSKSLPTQSSSPSSTGESLINTLSKNLPSRPSRPRRPSISEREAQRKRSLATDMAAATRQRDIESHFTRRWGPGDVYGPHDLSPAEMTKWRRAQYSRSQNRTPNPSRGRPDVFDALGVNPIKHYKNFAMMGEFVTEMGRIKHARETGLRPVNQRRMAKAVRRAVGLGLLPSVHVHPELLEERASLRGRLR